MIAAWAVLHGIEMGAAGLLFAGVTLATIAFIAYQRECHRRWP